MDRRRLARETGPAGVCIQALLSLLIVREWHRRSESSARMWGRKIMSTRPSARCELFSAGRAYEDMAMMQNQVTHRANQREPRVAAELRGIGLVKAFSAFAQLIVPWGQPTGPHKSSVSTSIIRERKMSTYTLHRTRPVALRRLDTVTVSLLALVVVGMAACVDSSVNIVPSSS